MGNKNNNPLFNGVKNVTLRDWNRCSIFFNLCGSEGVDAGKVYAKQVPMDERQGMWDMFKRIKDEGYEFTRAAVNREIQNEDFAHGTA